MKRFGGGAWGEELELVETPVGEPCLYCEEPIAAGDQGVVVPWMDGDGASWVAEHHECFLRGGFGSVGHQRGECSCFGGRGEGDPEGMTKREAARAAVACFKASLRIPKH